MAKARALLCNASPWILFAIVLGWSWRTRDLFHSVTAYGDVLEGAWVVGWLDRALRLGLDPLVSPLVFHPGGYQTITYAWGPANFVLLLPLYRIGGAAFAINVATLLSFLIAFAGMYLLALRFSVGRLGATVAALLFTFWGFRWYSVTGQLNISMGSALLPWLLWSLERGHASPRHVRLWNVLAGVLWATSAYCSLYFIWIDGVAFAGWLLGNILARGRDWRQAPMEVAWAPLVAALACLPLIFLFWRSGNLAGTPFFSIYDINVLGASANSLPIPSLAHPFLGSWLTRLSQGRLSGEANGASLGSFACLAGLVGLAAVFRRKEWWPLLALGGLGLILALGITLRWSDQTVQSGAFAVLDRIIWSAGHALKPQVFPGSMPPAPFTKAVALPGMLLAAIIPAFERARVFARYAFLAGIVVFLLAGFALSQLRLAWLRLVLAGLLIFETLPPPTLSWPFPPSPHPAFAWLREHSVTPAGLLELSPTTGYRLEMPLGGAPAYATLYHDQDAVSGPGSVLPAQADFLGRWLVSHAHPFRDDEFTTLLGYYGLRYIALHVGGDWKEEALEEAGQNPNLRFIACFPGAGSPPWGFPMCLYEFLPRPPTAMNVLFGDGWSGAEAWGRWIDGTKASALWIGSAGRPYRLHVGAFPMCLADKHQQVTFYANGIPIGMHQWSDCEPWSADLAIPASAVRPGPNELTIEAGYAARPLDTTGGSNEDPRRLSVGVTALHIDEAP